jgi:PhnB protein
MLEMRRTCEHCSRALPQETAYAMICSFECTFCKTCGEGVLQGQCPNCGGALVARPPRAPQKVTARLPAGFNTVTPYYFVDDADGFVRFLVAGLAGTEVLRSLRPDGAIANAQVKLGTSTVMVSEASPAYPAMQASCYLYVSDAHASMTRALCEGALLELEVADMPYGDRQGGVRDAWGNLWWISQRLVDTPYAV